MFELRGRRKRTFGESTLHSGFESALDGEVGVEEVHDLFIAERVHILYRSVVEAQR